MGPTPVWLVSLQEEIRTHRETPGAWEPCEEVARGWSSASQGEKPQKKPTLPVSQSGTSSLQTYEDIDLYYLVFQFVVFCYGSPRKLIQWFHSDIKYSSTFLSLPSAFLWCVFGPKSSFSHGGKGV
jgi:hypothetical protein